MQRRRNPRISSPALSSSNFKSDYRHSRNSIRTKPILFIIVLLGVTIFLVHRLLPRHTPPPLPSYASPNLKPTNYYNTSDTLSNPFPFCPINGPGDSLASKYSPGALTQTRMHLDSGHRVNRVLNRALSGLPITISVIGGSISACHGAGDDPISPNCYPSKFFDWWNTVFPHPATELTNGAMRRTTSDYFGFCSAHHLPDVTDLVIVELDSEDSPDENKTQNFEFLIRSLLNRPDQPAVILLGHFSPQLHEAYRFNGPDVWHDTVASFYEIPHLTTKPLLISDYLQDPKSINKYYADAILANTDGHTLIADVLISYMQFMVCQFWGNMVGNGDSSSGSGSGQGGGGGGMVDKSKEKDMSGLLGGIGLRKGVPEPGKKDINGLGGINNGDQADDDEERSTEDLPPKSTDSRFLLPPRLMSTIASSNTKDQQFEEIQPYCVSANDLINPLPPSLFAGSGWSAYHPPLSSYSASVGNQDVEGGATAAHYFYSTLPLSRIRFPIVIGHGDVGVYYLKEGKDRLFDDEDGSEIECWVDDNYNGRKRLGNLLDDGRDGVQVTLEIIDQFVAKGSHYVECELLGDEGKGVPMFKVVGIFAN